MRPMSMRATWKASNLVDVDRIPMRDRRLELAWRWANRTERVLFLTLPLLLSCAVGPLLWVAARPSRRLGFYLMAAALLIGLCTAGR